MITMNETLQLPTALIIFYDHNIMIMCMSLPGIYIHGDLKLGLKYIIVLVLLYCRNAGPINDSDEPTDYEECNDFREPLFNFASNNDS